MPALHLTPWFSRCFFMALLFSSAWVNAQNWPEAHLRGTPNNWSATAMSWNTTTGLWETQLAFSGTNQRFKISRYANNWNEAYPAQDYPITQGDGDYKITFNDATKVISLSKVAQTLSPNTICYNNPGNHANPTIYFWNPVPSGSVSPLPAWPGNSMTRRGNFFCYDFSALLSNGVMPASMGIIFSNNGSAQTTDLTFNGAGCYENGNWKTLQQCGFSVSGISSSSSSATSSSTPSSSSSSYSPNTHFATVTNSAGATDSRLTCYGAQAGAACDLRIYQVMVESFIDGDANANFNTGYGTSHHKGDLQGIINSLDYIASLGVNAIWLTPIFHSVPIAGQDDGANRLDATGYFASNYFAVDPRFGSEAQLRELIETAHAKGMYVFLDGVFGHFKANANDYPSPSGRRVSTHGGPQGGTGRLSVYPNDLEFFKEVAAYWIANFKIDGWRLDQAYQVPASYWDDIRAVVEQTSSAVSYTNAQGQSVNPLGYMVGEVWKGENDIANEAYGSPSATALKSAFDFPLRYKLVQTLAVEESGLGNSAASNLNLGFATHQAYPGHAMPNLMLGNHDLVRFGDLLQRGNIANPADAGYWQRHKAAFSFMTAFSGPITLYYGDEIGQELPNFSAAVNPCNGSSGLCDDHVSRTSGFIEGISTTLGSGVATLSQQQRELKNYVSELMNLRAAYPALSQGSRTHIFSNNHVYIDRKDKNGSRVLYVLNTKGVPAVVDIAATAIGATQPLVDLQNPLQGYENIAGNYRLELEPFEALFLNISNGSSSSSSLTSSTSSMMTSSSGSSVGGVISANSICFNNPNNYIAPHIYFWAPVPNGSLSPLPVWPGRSLAKRGTFFCYDFSNELTTGLMPTSLRVVFNNSGAPQTADLTYSGAGCYEDGNWKSLQSCGFTVIANQSSSAASSSSSLAQSSSSSSAVSHSSISASSVNSAATSSAMTQTTTGIYFYNNQTFTTPYIHFFNLQPVAENSSWPGLAMQDLGEGWYRHDFPSAVTQGCVVFSNNGAPQTLNLCFSAPNTCYRDNQWQTPEACGVPSGLTANAGVDRKANVGTRQALSAAASVGDYVTASWTSPAWSGALTGEQVVTPVLDSIGSYPVTLTLTAANNQSATDTATIEVVAAAQGLPERPQLAAPLGFPITGSVATGNYRFVQAFPALAGAFPSPVQIANDGINDLIYVVDKRGTLHVFPNQDDVAPTEVRTLLDIRNQVRDFHEAGLLSVAFDPDYFTNGFFYVYYIHGTNDNEKNADGSYGDSVLERWTVNDPLNPTGVVANSRAELLRVPQPGPDHKGGMMQFHPTEGYLYLGIGDGAYGHSAITSYPQDPRTNNSGQQTNNLLGTFIRIKPLVTPVNGKYYEVPADNPFVGVEGFRPEIWSYGHRNPWRWSFDPQAPHTLWETEVGQQGFEEVNLIDKGKNYGWPICEGTTNRGDLGGDPTKDCTTEFEPPREGYGRSQGVSIVGGLVYRGTSLPALQGKFIFGDYVSKRIWSMIDGGSAKQVVSEAFPGNIASFGTDVAGESVLVTTYQMEYGGQASIYRMLDDASEAAQIPARLSDTGLFADLINLIPAHGVIEYGINTQGWFDGAAARHFIALPNDANIGFDPTAVWDLPIGTVLVKHLSVETASNPAKAFTTSVLFRQEGGWQAANYRWNAAGTDADLVKESVTVADGGLVNRQRIVQTGSDCGSCHQGVGSKNPLGLHTRQLNGDFSYQGVADSQLELFNSIGLFSGGISNAASYEAFAELDAAGAEQTTRIKAYLHTNCAHCHASSFMDMRYDTPLAQMRLINEGGNGVTKRVLPGDHSNSMVHIYQTTDGNRMPKGSFYTNPVADVEFAQWIDGLNDGLEQTGVSLRSNRTSVATGGTITLTLEAVFDNGTTGATNGAVIWVSSDPTVVDVAGQTGSVLTLTAGAQGSVTITAEADGYSDEITLTVSNASSSSSSSSAASITGIAIAPEAIALSSSQQLVAYGLREDGSRANLFGHVSWRMASGSDVATVSASGLLTRLKAGTAVVEARYQDLTSTLTINGVAPGVHLRFENTSNWTNVRAYLWTVVNGVNRAVAPWPGTPMTGPDADGYWTVLVAPEHLNNGSINVVFNNGSGTQTEDYTRTESSSFNASTKAWTPWNPGGPINSTLYRLSVIGGSTPDDARDFPAGTVVTVTADEAPYGTTFSGWTGDGLPYVFSDPAEPVVKLVVPAHGLALQALFQGDSHGAARDRFASQCASCHGTNGTGGLAEALDGLHQSSAWTVELLAQYINDYMPMGNNAQCSGIQPGGCAYDIASMIMADAWEAPSSCEGSACDTRASLDARNLRLLTREEYLNTVRDIFVLDFAADVLSPVPADGTVRNYNTASSLTLNDDRTLGYQMVAEDIADLIITSKGFMGLANGCDNATCVVTNLGKKLFRRPLTNAEVTRYVGLYEDADGGRGVLQALLISPKFMYRSEMGVQDGESDLYRLSNYEIATLLSYTFWVSAPDELLLDAAAGNDFNIQAQVERLLADPRSDRGLRRFAKGWLINNKYGFNAISDSTLVEHFKEETIRFVMESIKDNVPVNTVLTANYTYADQLLAQYYGLASVPPANTWEKIFHVVGDPRAGTGVLGHGSFLASRASSRPAPIQRGVFVREVLMCQEFPPPAAANFDVTFEPSDTNRDATSRHTSDPGCKACHQYIDGVGFGFERLGSDALLRATETLGNGTVVDVIATGVMKSLNSPETTLDPNSPEIHYNTVAELAELIAGSGQAEACYSRQFYRYVVGRSEAEDDEPIIRSYSTDVRLGGGMRDMLIDLTLNDSFIMRR